MHTAIQYKASFPSPGVRFDAQVTIKMEGTRGGGRRRGGGERGGRGRRGGGRGGVVVVVVVVE